MKGGATILGFFLGIALFSFTPLSLFLIGMLAFLASVFLVLAHVRRTQAFLLSALFFVGASVGGFHANTAHGTLPSVFLSKLDTDVSLVGKIIKEPDIRETTTRLTLLVEEEGVETKVLVVAPLYPETRYGEIVKVSGTLVRPEPFDTDGGRVFRYDLFLAKDGIYTIVERASLEVVSQRTGVPDSILGFFSDLKAIGMKAISQALPEPQAGLASGLILGGKQGLGKDLLDDFIVAGLVHIVVLSGYNVMIIAEAMLRVFSVVAKRYAVLCAGVVIVGFVLVAGAGPASVRAGVMAAIALFGRATGRIYDAFRALMVAGVLMLLWNPLLLVHDPGFQLSFIATLGLIFGAPITERWVLFVRPRFLRDILAATLAAQIAVLPLLLYQNGLFSLVSLPANALILPVVPLAMAFSALAGIIGFLAPPVAPLFGLPAYVLLSFIIGATEFFAELPFAAVSVPAFPFGFVILLYGALTLFVFQQTKTSAR